ncbi:hypothetical protein GF327_04820 [Candidatus Woesearchaeota archaeon]|nr:hypothetical protein [Candidatus Woesearchaeota archaeon]
MNVLNEIFKRKDEMNPLDLYVQTLYTATEELKQVIESNSFSMDDLSLLDLPTAEYSTNIRIPGISKNDSGEYRVKHESLGSLTSETLEQISQKVRQAKHDAGQLGLGYHTISNFIKKTIECLNLQENIEFEQAHKAIYDSAIEKLKTVYEVCDSLDKNLPRMHALLDGKLEEKIEPGKEAEFVDEIFGMGLSYHYFRMKVSDEAIDGLWEEYNNLDSSVSKNYRKPECGFTTSNLQNERLCQAIIQTNNYMQAKRAYEKKFERYLSAVRG